MTRMRTLAVLGLAASPLACSVADTGGVAGPRNVSDYALAALPEGVPPAVLIRDGNGCYGIAVEQAEPIIGVPLLDDFDQPICDV